MKSPLRTTWWYARRFLVAGWRAGWLRLVLAITAVAGLLWLVVVGAPPWFVDDQSLEGLKAQNEVRTTLLQGLAGLVLLVGAYFTYRQLHTAREGQITERYTRAIDQLGHSEVDVRLGGIYALERIARDSLADRLTIGEVLTAFVRSHAPWPPSLPGQDAPDTPIRLISELQVRAPDVQASLKVLGRGRFTPPKAEGEHLDLHGVDLRNARMTRAHLEGAFLYDSHLERAVLLEAHLEGARLHGCHLQEAVLRDAHLEGAILHFSRLEGAILHGAHLDGIEELEFADLAGAKADEHTSWPDGYDWRAAGVVPRSAAGPA